MVLAFNPYNFVIWRCGLKFKHLFDCIGIVLQPLSVKIIIIFGITPRNKNNNIYLLTYGVIALASNPYNFVIWRCGLKFNHLFDCIGIVLQPLSVKIIFIFGITPRNKKININLLTYGVIALASNPYNFVIWRCGLKFKHLFDCIGIVLQPLSVKIIFILGITPRNKKINIYPLTYGVIALASNPYNFVIWQCGLQFKHLFDCIGIVLQPLSVKIIFIFVITPTNKQNSIYVLNYSVIALASNPYNFVIWRCGLKFKHLFDCIGIVLQPILVKIIFIFAITPTNIILSFRFLVAILNISLPVEISSWQHAFSDSAGSN